MSDLTMRQRIHQLFICLVTWFVVTLVCWLRLDPTTRGTIWAEDGMFLAERRSSGPVSTLFDPYAGYLHVVPRLLVDVAALAPLRRFAVLDTALCCAAVGIAGVVVFVCSQSVLQNVPARLTLAGVAGLVPAGPVEILGNVANLHWYLLWVTPWLLLSRPQRWWHSGVLAAVALLVTLTEIQAAAFLPLALLHYRERRRWPIVVAFAAGVVAQVSVTVTSPRPVRGGPSAGFADIAKGFLFNVVLPLWHASVDGPGESFARYGWWLALLAFIPFIAALAALLVLTLRLPPTSVAEPGSLQALVVLVVLLVGTLVPLVAGLILNFQASYEYGSQDPAVLADVRPLRYGVVSGMFLLASLIVLADRLCWRRNAASPLMALLLLAVVALGVINFAPDTRRSHGPTWSTGVFKAKIRCQNNPELDAVSVPIAPSRQGWHVTLSCSTLS